MHVWKIPANTGDWPNYKTPKVKGRGMDPASCDRCPSDATHTVGEYAVGNPHRFCCVHYREHRQWREGAVLRIAAMRNQVRSDLTEKMPALAEVLGL